MTAPTPRCAGPRITPLRGFFTELMLPRISEDATTSNSNIVLCSDNAKGPTNSFRQHRKLIDNTTMVDDVTRGVKTRPRRVTNLRRGAVERRLPIFVPSVTEPTDREVEAGEIFSSKHRRFDSDPTNTMTRKSSSSSGGGDELQYGPSHHPLYEGRSASLSEMPEESSSSRWDAERVITRSDSDSVLIRPTRLVRPQRRISPKQIPTLRCFQH